MPISSGAGGRAASRHPHVGADKRAFWPNDVSAAGDKFSRISRTRSPSIAVSNRRALNQLPTSPQAKQKLVASSNSRRSSVSSQSSAAQNQPSTPTRSAAKEKLTKTKHQQANKVGAPPPSVGRERRHTCNRDSSLAGARSSTTANSPAAIKLVGNEINDNNNNNVRDNQVVRQTKRDPVTAMNSAADQPARTTDATKQQPKFALAPSINFALRVSDEEDDRHDYGCHYLKHEHQGAHANNANTSMSSSLLGSLLTFGAANQKAYSCRTNDNNDKTTRNTQSTTMNKRLANGANPGLADHYRTTATINQHNGQSPLNPSMSPAFSARKPGGCGEPAPSGQTASTSSSTAHLHSLSSLHQRPTTTISKRINLKYIKTLIMLLMSLDLMITIGVHHFASHDEFSLALTSTKLRLSLVNLVLSAVWFVVLSGAILFDIYFVLLIGSLVDVASFILLLACSAIHFTYRIDYNTVNLTSLLLLLFAIIILHVYLLVITSLTIYLMLAVKRRRKHRNG
jgi:hypothetical protein